MPSVAQQKVERWCTLQVRRRDLKQAGRQIREALHETTAEIATLERECRALGIALVPSPGVGARVHGHQSDDSRPDSRS